MEIDATPVQGFTKIRKRWRIYSDIHKHGAYTDNFEVYVYLPDRIQELHKYGRVLARVRCQHAPSPAASPEHMTKCNKIFGH